MKKFYSYLEKVNNFYFESNPFLEKGYILDLKKEKEIKDKNGNLLQKINLYHYTADDFGIFELKDYTLYIKYKRENHERVEEYGPFNLDDSNKDSNNSIYYDVYEKEYEYTDPDHSEIFRKILYGLRQLISDYVNRFELINKKIYVWADGIRKGPFEKTINISDLYRLVFDNEYMNGENDSHSEGFLDDYNDFIKKQNLD